MASPRQQATGAKEYFAKIPRAVVVAKVSNTQRFEERVFWAIVLLSWCGPEISDVCVRKDAGGYIERNAAGHPAPATQADIRRLLGLSEERKGHVSRAFDQIRELGFIWIDAENNFGPVDNPAVRTNEEAASIRNRSFKLPGLAIELPADPDRNQQAITELKPIRCEYNAELKQLRHKTREKARPVMERLNLKTLRKSASQDVPVGELVTSTSHEEVASTDNSTDGTGNQISAEVTGNGDFWVPVSGTSGRPDIIVEIPENSIGEYVGRSKETNPLTDLPAPVLQFRDECCAVLRNCGLKTRPADSWWGYLYRAIETSDGHHDHFLRRLGASVNRVTAWEFLTKCTLPDIAGGREQWLRDNPVQQVQSASTNGELDEQNAYKEFCQQTAAERAAALDPADRDGRLNAKLTEVKTSWPRLPADQQREIAERALCDEIRTEMVASGALPTFDQFRLGQQQKGHTA